LNRKVIRLSTVSWRGACTTSPSARISPWSFLSVRNARVAVSAKRTAVGSAHARDGHNARRRIDDEECPSRAEVLGRGVGKQRLKPRERAEVSGRSRRRSPPSARRPRAEPGSSRTARDWRDRRHGCAQPCGFARAPGEAAPQIVDVEVREVRVRRQRGVQALDVRVMMLVVMELHRLGVDGRLQGFVSESQGGSLKAMAHNLGLTFRADYWTFVHPKYAKIKEADEEAEHADGGAAL